MGTDKLGRLSTRVTGLAQNPERAALASGQDEGWVDQHTATPKAEGTPLPEANISRWLSTLTAVVRKLYETGCEHEARTLYTVGRRLESICEECPRGEEVMSPQALVGVTWMDEVREKQVIHDLKMTINHLRETHPQRYQDLCDLSGILKE